MSGVTLLKCQILHIYNYCEWVIVEILTLCWPTNLMDTSEYYTIAKLKIILKLLSVIFQVLRVSNISSINKPTRPENSVYIGIVSMCEMWINTSTIMWHILSIRQY